MFERRILFRYGAVLVTAFTVMLLFISHMPLLQSTRKEYSVRGENGYTTSGLDGLPLETKFGPRPAVKKTDKLLSKDDDSVAKKLYDEVRVLCWVMTSDTNLPKKARHVQATWGRRCNKVLFVSDHKDDDFPTIDVTVQKGRQHLTAKSMKAFDYIYKNHYDDADWFLKADDDTYVIVENLRYFLSSQTPSDPVYFGHHFTWKVKQGYHSGGAGYVLSREALRRFGNRKNGTCANDFGAEDVEVGRCLHRLGVSTGDSRDVMGRSRFHCLPPSRHILGQFPNKYDSYEKYGAKKGMDVLSDYAISFHYIKPDEMYTLEYLIYHLKTQGIVHGPLDVNYVKASDKARDTTVT